MTNHAISLINLNKNYGKINALKNITLNICEGDAYGLIGPNGAGKTTLIMLLLGLIKPSSGNVLILNANPFGSYEKVGQKVGIVLDNHGLYDHLTAYENMELFAGFLIDSLRNRRDKIKKLLEQMHLWERKDDKVSEYSKGMKQRLAIARSLINDPELLIMDEPLSALDPESHKIIIEFIRNLNQNRVMTILMTSHNLYDIENLCSHVGILNQGTLVATDTISNLRSKRAVNVLEVKFSIQNRNDIETDLNKIPGISEYVFLSNEVVRLKIKNEYPTHSVISQLALYRIPVREIREVGNSLEDIYMEIVRPEVTVNER